MLHWRLDQTHELQHENLQYALDNVFHHNDSLFFYEHFDGYVTIVLILLFSIAKRAFTCLH